MTESLQFRGTSAFVALVSVLGHISCSSGNAHEEDVGQFSEPLVVYDTLPTSGVKTVSAAVWPGVSTYIIMNSPSAGSWRFETYGSPASWNGCVQQFQPDFAVYTYWRNTNSGSTWNYWPGGGPVCYPSSIWSTVLSSGSGTIQYKLQYEGYSSYGETVYAKFTKQ